MRNDVHPPPVEVDEEMYGIDPERNIDNNDDQNEELQVRLYPINCFLILLNCRLNLSH